MVYCLACVGLLISSVNAEEKKEFKNPEEAVSYSIGFQMGAEFVKHGVAADPEMIAEGMRDGLSGAEPRLSEADMKARLSGLEAQVKQAKQKEMEEQAAKTLAEGEAFLAENGEEEGDRDPAERSPVSGPSERRRAVSESHRQGDGSLSGDLHRWKGVRQLLQSREAYNLRA
jgi:hypothetical protein